MPDDSQQNPENRGIMMEPRLEPKTFKRRGGKDRNRKKATICFRIENQLKDRLQAAASKESRTLSSLIDRVLQGFLDSQDQDGPPWTIKDEKRLHPRKEVLLPARWKIGHGDSVVEHDVLIRNIGAGGAYTECVSGQSMKLVEKLQVAPFALALRMPGSEQPVELDCEARHIHINEKAVGVGLLFKNIVEDLSL